MEKELTEQGSSDNIQLRRNKIQQKEVKNMTKRENEILIRLAQIIPTLPETKQERILGVAEGMSVMKDTQEQKTA